MDEASPSKSSPHDNLSERQVQTLTLVAEGLTSKEIGRELGVSPSTVDNHIRAAIDRLGAKNRQQAARMIQAAETAHGGPGQLAVSMTEAPDTDRFEWWKFPPLGGRPNTLTPTQRIYHILQIALFAVVAVSAAILTIAGVVHILSK